MFNWYDIISWGITLASLFWAIYERFLSERDKAYIKSSIRIWQHQAQGLARSIESLAWASGNGFSLVKFSATQDVGIALGALHDVAESMSQSLYESRFFTDDELKENIKKDKEKAENAVKNISKRRKRKGIKVSIDALK